MRVLPYQLLVLAGVAASAAHYCLRFLQTPDLQLALDPILEAAGFVLCGAGVVTGSTAIRASFDKFGRNVVLAARDASYMRQRFIFRISVLPAAPAIASLMAPRLDIDPLVAATAVGVLSIAGVVLVDRLTSWR